MRPIVVSAGSVEQLESRLDEALQEGPRPALAIVFGSVSHDLEKVAAAFAKHDIDVFGASTAGEILNDEVLEESVVAMLLDVRREAYQLRLFEWEGKSSAQIGQSVGQWARNIYDKPALMLVSTGHLANGDFLVDGVIDGMGGQGAVFGGMAGDDAKFQGTFVFDRSRTSSNGTMALIFDGDVIGLHGMAFSGWKGIGTTKTVTKAKNDVVYEIDGEPALDTYATYIDVGGGLEDMLVASQYPLLLNRDDGSSILRVPLQMNEDKSLVFVGSVPEGAKVRFGMAPGPEVIDNVIEQISDFKKQAPRAEAIVFFSCLTRHITFGPLVEDEISAVRKLWDVPMIGFFTYGEIGPVLQGRCAFHNLTLVPVLIYKK